MGPEELTFPKAEWYQDGSTTLGRPVPLPLSEDCLRALETALRAGAASSRDLVFDGEPMRVYITGALVSDWVRTPWGLRITASDIGFTYSNQHGGALRATVILQGSGDVPQSAPVDSGRVRTFALDRARGWVPT